MTSKSERIQELILKIEELIPKFLEQPADRSVSNGNTAVCIIDDERCIYGKIFSPNNEIRARESYRVAWIKASQVWLTGMKTGEYEKKIYSGEMDEETIGIGKPDMIGWEGGQPISLPEGIKLSVGFSGFRGVSDLAIVQQAAELLK